YRRNAHILAECLEKAGIWFTGGKHSPYLWLKCPGNMGSWEFFDMLLEKANLVGTPGEGFGECGKGFFRLTSFGSYENTLKAVSRLEKFFRENFNI
ncbi:MAG: LL-diaminopimelate aminotransferase, partial [Victivallales bacterium]